MPNIPVTSKPRLPICRVCREAVQLETGRTDENVSWLSGKWRGSVPR
jgi:hypothetical protein